MPIFERSRYHLRTVGPDGDPHASNERLHFDRFERGTPGGRGPDPFGSFRETFAPWRRNLSTLLLVLTPCVLIVVALFAYFDEPTAPIGRSLVDRDIPSVELPSLMTSRPPVIVRRGGGIVPPAAPVDPDSSTPVAVDPLSIAPPVVDRFGRIVVDERVWDPPRSCDDAPIPFGDGVLSCRDLKPLDARPVASVEPVVGAPVGILGAIGARIGLPTAVATFKAEGETAGRDAYLAALSVDDKGRIVSASPLAQRLALYVETAALVFGAGVLAAAIVRGLRRSAGSFLGPGDTSVYFGFLACLVAAGGLGSTLPGIPGWEYALLIAVAAVSCGDLRTGLSRMSLAVAICAVADLLQVPIAPPYAQLAPLYGPAGLYVWDFSLLAVAACLCLWLPGRVRYL